MIVKGGPKPALWIRRQAVEPRYDSKPKWWIIKQLAERLGVGQYFPYDSLEELLAWQLEDIGFKPSDFDDKGYVELAPKQILFDRKTDLPFNTSSGKLEFVSSMLEENKIPSFPDYKSPEPPSEGNFRLITGKIAVHTQGTTLNNKYLNEIQSENRLWMNEDEAKKLGIEDNDLVEVSCNGVSQTVRAAVTEFIHP